MSNGFPQHPPGKGRETENGGTGVGVRLATHGESGHANCSAAL